MSISKITGPRPWEARVRENGRELKRRFTTKRLAEEFVRDVREREERRRNGIPDQLGPITYSDLVDRFLAQYSARTMSWFEDMLDYSKDQFGELEVRRLRPDEISAWLNNLSHAPKTKQHIRNAMKQVLGAGVEWGYLPTNPVRNGAVRLPKVKRPDIRPFASWDEVKAVAAHAGAHGPLITFACATGLRPQEWIPLTWADLDLEQRLVSINKTYTKGALENAGKTDAALRVVQLQQRAVDAINELIEPANRQTLVFPAIEGGYINLDNWRRRVWRKALEDAKLPGRPLYQMRHTYATLALAAGADLAWISQQLGHTDISVTLRHYARFTKPAHDRNLALLNKHPRKAGA